ncbi:Eco57I restriction-modification methylase domain-containing protein [Hoyosella subflava]|uniref:site-specific DNA-methyltransferase (adenine-specific) n=1 Tax=Hoyosella subflava (strain DSM 45089 / JCM 17490 / NBRC 109087 / DQS3-9A1) TaxID=443218 RepID=F6EL70_HOYSD|nr:Eco57I restriction-modification methylase domain-containing protein [Hoyosella subflava]AEF42733.1 Eco57I restriction endonuclease [Hoyosella subflava DQS3-9A1]
MSIVTAPQGGPDMNDAIRLRPLGARGSRSDISASEVDLAPTALAVLAAIPSWWESRARAAHLQGAWLDVRSALEAQPPVELPAAQTPTETPWTTLLAEEIGMAYVDSLAASTRARHGRHYTPRELATKLWSMTRSALDLPAVPQRLRGLVRDPACGAGALLLAPLREHLHASAGDDPEFTLASIANLIEGVDTDPAAVWITNVLVAAELLPTLARIPEQRRRPIPAVAQVGDGLRAADRPARVVIMNPPYGRVRLAPSERDRYAHLLYGHANLYGLFLGTGIESLDDDGVLTALVPTSFTSGRYFEQLRSYIGEVAGLSAITFVEDRSGVFTSVLQETCLATFERRRRRTTTVTSLGSAETPIARVKLQRSSSPWILPRRSDHAPVAASAARMTNSLGSIGWGVSTGPLVWNRRRADLYPHWGASRSYVIWAADIDGGHLHRDAARDAMRYLALSQKSDPAVMVLDQPAVLVQRTTAPEQRRRLVAAQLTANDLGARHGRVTVENHVNVVRPIAPRPLLTAETLTRVLGTSTMDQVIRAISGSVAVSAYELEALPFPSTDIVIEWNELSGTELEEAVHNAYCPLLER